MRRSENFCVYSFSQVYILLERLIDKDSGHKKGLIKHNVVSGFGLLMLFQFGDWSGGEVRGWSERHGGME